MRSMVDIEYRCNWMFVLFKPRTKVYGKPTHEHANQMTNRHQSVNYNLNILTHNLQLITV